MELLKMKKRAIFSISLFLVFSAFGQDDEKQEVTQETRVLPAVVHEEAPKKTAVQAADTKVQVDTSKVAVTATQKPDSNTSDFTNFASQNTELIILSGAVLLYLLFVWFLSFASKTPEIAMAITRGIYYIIGFPVILTLMIFRLLKNSISVWASDYQSRLSEMGYSSGNQSGAKEIHTSSSYRNRSEGSSDSSDSRSGSNNSSNQSSNTKEWIDFQLQTKTGTWITLSASQNNSDNGIANAMKNLEHRVSNRTDATGHIRAKGRATGRIYDIR